MFILVYKYNLKQVKPFCLKSTVDVTPCIKQWLPNTVQCWILWLVLSLCDHTSTSGRLQVLKTLNKNRACASIQAESPFYLKENTHIQINIMLMIQQQQDGALIVSSASSYICWQNHKDWQNDSPKHLSRKLCVSVGCIQKHTFAYSSHTAKPHSLPRHRQIYNIYCNPTCLQGISCLKFVSE